MPKSDRAFLCIALMLIINKQAVLEHRNQLAEGKKRVICGFLNDNASQTT